MKERAPYKYLDYYTFEDADIFFGREEETQKMVGEILSTKLLVLFSPSGSGKTSLIHAGVRPALEKLGYRTIYARFDGPDPISSVRNAVANALNLPATNSNDDLHGFLAHTVTSDQLSVTSAQRPASRIQDQASSIQQPVVIFIDQFEEFFLVFDKQPEARKAFIEQVAKIKYDDTLPVFLVFSLREDYFANLHEFREAIPSIFQNNANLRLEPFTEEEARRAIAEPVKQFGYEYDEGLVQTLVADLKNGNAGIEPIALQIVCHTLWQNRPNAIAPSNNAAPNTAPKIDATVYKKCHGVQAIINEHTDRLLRQIPQRQQGFMVRIFEALKTRDNTKLYRRVQDLQETLRLRDSTRLQSALQKLAEIGVLGHEHRSGDDWYEFKHDYLVPEVTKWIQARREGINKRRLWYMAAPGAVLFVGLLAYLIIQYNTFYASFTNREYPEQSREIFIARRIDPFNERITTGLFLQDARDQPAENLLEDKFDISTWDRNNFTRLAQTLRLDKAGLFLYQIGETQAGIDSLVAALKDGDEDVRAQAAGALGEIKSSDERVVGALVAALKDERYEVRDLAVSAVVKLGQSNDRVVDALVAALNDVDGDVRVRAASALVKLEQSDDRVVGSLLAALQDESFQVRGQAASALGEIKISDDRVVTALVAALKDVADGVRAQAAGALGKLGQSDDRLVSALVGALKDQKDSYGDVRVSAAGALGKIKVSNDSVVSTLIALLTDEYESVRLQAAAALVKLGRSDDHVMDALVAALKDANSGVRAQAAGMLGEITVSDNRVVDALVAALKNEWYEVRVQAVVSLGKLGRSDDLVVGALITALKDQNEFVRAQAAGALGEITVSDDRVVGALVAALTDQYENVRVQVAGALGKLGKSDDRLVSALVGALKDQKGSYGDVRVSAAGALGKIKVSNDRVVD
ncbi:HEAT repeat domain-containing protein, partial [candidate division KSB1 bacterium]|nr:HEAT repeat domain-containing protein [candidate division KSB1 bacterium]